MVPKKGNASSSRILLPRNNPSALSARKPEVSSVCSSSERVFFESSPDRTMATPSPVTICRKGSLLRLLLSSIFLAGAMPRATPMRICSTSSRADWRISSNAEPLISAALTAPPPMIINRLFTTAPCE